MNGQRDYSQWHSSMHDDEPRDLERDLRIAGHGYWASIGPDSRETPDDWSWDIQEFDGQDNREVDGGFVGSETAARQSVDDWEAAHQGGATGRHTAVRKSPTVCDYCRH